MESFITTPGSMADCDGYCGVVYIAFEILIRAPSVWLCFAGGQKRRPRSVVNIFRNRAFPLDPVFAYRPQYLQLTPKVAVRSEISCLSFSSCRWRSGNAGISSGWNAIFRANERGCSRRHDGFSLLYVTRILLWVLLAHRPGQPVSTSDPDRGVGIEALRWPWAQNILKDILCPCLSLRTNPSCTAIHPPASSGHRGTRGLKTTRLRSLTGRR